MSKLVKGIYAKDHGTSKKGDEKEFAESTFKALQAHGILKGGAKADKADKKPKADKAIKGKKGE